MKKKGRKIKLISIIISCVLITNYFILVFSDFSENNPNSIINSIPVCSDTYNRTIFEDDFESGSSKWSSVTGLWHLTNSSSSWTDPYHSFEHSMWFGQESTGNYDTGSAVEGNLTSIEFDLSFVDTATVEFYHWREGQEYGDPFSVYISTDGVEWDTKYIYSLDISPWEKREIDLSSYCGYNSVQIRFLFVAGGSNNDYRGWLVDDVKVYGTFDMIITNSPSDFTVEDGYTGQSISWTATNPYANTYTIELEGSGIVAGPTAWTSGVAITYDIPDGFAVGNYVYTVIFTDDDGNSVTDNVTFSLEGVLGIMFCIDVSISMNAEMVENAKHSAHLIMDLVSNDTFVGLVTFARYSYINVSLNRINETNQRSNIEGVIDSMTTNPYTNIYSALTDCIEEFNRYSFSSKHIILMSDGLPNQAEPGYEQFTSRSSDVWITDLDSPVLIANDSNILIHTVGYGSYNQALLEAFSSTTVSNSTTGEFFTSSESNALVMYFAKLNGWKEQLTYNDNVQEDETVLVCRYNIDVQYPYIRIWIFWDESEECVLELIVKDHNEDNMTSISSGGQNPPLYAYYNCTGIDYIDIYILGKEINTTIDISWTCSIESNENYEALISEGGDMIFFIIIILTIMISLAICTAVVFRKSYISKKKKREIVEDINNLQPKSS